MSDTVSPPVDGPRGFGGWLLLPALHVLLLAALDGLALFGFIDGLLEHGLAPPPRQYLHLFEFVARIGFFLYIAVIVQAMVQRLRFFPEHYGRYLILDLAFVVVDVIAAAQYGIEIEKDDVQKIVRSILTCVIWLPYLSLSVRVRNTFVNG